MLTLHTAGLLAATTHGADDEAEPQRPNFDPVLASAARLTLVPAGSDATQCASWSGGPATVEGDRVQVAPPGR
jgi:hypothetical protein